MKQFRLVNIVYAFLLLFFVLTGSHNLNGERLGQTLGIAVILFLVVGYINNRTKEKKGWIVDFLITLVVLTCAYQGLANSITLALLILFWPLLHTFHPDAVKGKVLLITIQALVLFCILYFSINQYSFENLRNTRVLGMIFVFICQYFFIATQFRWHKSIGLNRDLGLSFVIALFSLAIYAWQMFGFKYSIYLLVAAVPSFFFLFRIASLETAQSQLSLVKYFRVSTLSVFSIYNFYLFLDTSQVLQAVMGGY